MVSKMKILKIGLTIVGILVAFVVTFVATVLYGLYKLIFKFAPKLVSKLLDVVLIVFTICSLIYGAIILPMSKNIELFKLPIELSSQNLWFFIVIVPGVLLSLYLVKTLVLNKRSLRNV